MKTNKLLLAKHTIANLNPVQLRAANGGTGLACNLVIQSAACVHSASWVTRQSCCRPSEVLDTQEGITTVINPSFTNEMQTGGLRFTFQGGNWRP